MNIFQITGTIDPPDTFSGYYRLEIINKGPFVLIANLIALIVTIAAIYSMINFIIAGYLYLSSYGDKQKIIAAGNKILQTLIGLIVIAVAYLIAGLVGYLLFKDTSFLIKPKLFQIPF